MHSIRAPPKGQHYMNDTIALILLGLVLFIVQSKYDRRDRDLADQARRYTWLAWKAMHPELFTPNSKGDRLDRTFFASTTNQPPTWRRSALWSNPAHHRFPTV